MSFKVLDTINFNIEKTITWGVKKDKYSGFTIPVLLDDQVKDAIISLVSKHKTHNPLYGNTIYLKSKNLSDKQKKELFNKGKSSVLIQFKLTGIYEKTDNSYLTFKVTKLRKLEDVADEDSCPED